MNSLKQLYRQSSTTDKLVRLGMILAFIGFLDATYLTALHILGDIPKCFATSRCELVLTSEYAKLGMLPTAAYGIIFYAGMLGLLHYYTLVNKRNVLLGTFGLATAGVTVTAYLVYLQKFVIGAFCMYCLASAVISTLLFCICLFIAFFAEKRIQQYN